MFKKSENEWCSMGSWLRISQLLTLLSLGLASCSPYPDLRVTGFTAEVVKTTNQYTGDMKITGYVHNHGAEFKYNGEVVLYRGNQAVNKMSFGNVVKGYGVIIEHNSTESCYAGPPSADALYSVKIEYSSAITAPKNEIDLYFENNEQTLSGSEICDKISLSYISSYRIQLLGLINQHRTGNGKNALTADTCLNKSAQGHSEWMHASKTLSHTGSNNSGFADRCKTAGCNCGSGAENIYEGSMVAQSCFDAWRTSTTGHNENMLGGHTKIGIGAAFGYITAVFD